MPSPWWNRRSRSPSIRRRRLASSAGYFARRHDADDDFAVEPEGTALGSVAARDPPTGATSTQAAGVTLTTTSPPASITAPSARLHQPRPLHRFVARSFPAFVAGLRHRLRHSALSEASRQEQPRPRPATLPPGKASAATPQSSFIRSMITVPLGGPSRHRFRCRRAALQLPESIVDRDPSLCSLMAQDGPTASFGDSCAHCADSSEGGCRARQFRRRSDGLRLALTRPAQGRSRPTPVLP